jgi:hypothetical protein
MTDNTPRPEPMSRESVLAVLDNEMASYEHFPFLLRDGVTVDFTEAVDRLSSARAAVAALYERCEALERAVKRAHCHAYGERMEGKFIRSNYHMIPSAEWKAIFAAASDAEGGG